MHAPSWTIFALVAAAGCGPIDLDLSHTGPSIAIDDNGSLLRIAGCADGELLGCNPAQPGDAMSATLDGSNVTVPFVGGDTASTDGSDELAFFPDIDLFGLDQFDVVTPAPSDPSIAVTIVGLVQPIELVPAFTINAPAHVTRSAGPVMIAWQPLPGVTPDRVTAFLESDCGDGDPHITVAAGSGAPPVTIDFATNIPADATTCTQTLHVAQQLPTNESGEVPFTMTKIGLLPITSTP